MERSGCEAGKGCRTEMAEEGKKGVMKESTGKKLLCEYEGNCEKVYVNEIRNGKEKMGRRHQGKKIMLCEWEKD